MEIRSDVGYSQDCASSFVIKASGTTINATTTNATTTNGRTWSDIIKNDLINSAFTYTQQIPITRRAIPDVSVDVPAIKDIAVYNDKAVKVTFEDGTFTKCVCDGDNTFDVYTGIAFCLFKRLLGKDGHKKFNRLMHYAMKCDKEICKQREIDAQKAKEAREKAKKAAEKRAAKQANKRQGQIDIQRQAVLEALRTYKSEGNEV